MAATTPADGKHTDQTDRENEMTTEAIDYEYAVRTRDDLRGERIVEKPTLAEAQARVDYLRKCFAIKDTYNSRAEVLIRPVAADGRVTEWMALTDEEVAEIQDEAWEALDAAFTPVLAAGLAQLAKEHR